jgi:hypothetical protein
LEVGKAPVRPMGRPAASGRLATSPGLGLFQTVGNVNQGSGLVGNAVRRMRASVRQMGPPITSSRLAVLPEKPDKKTTGRHSFTDGHGRTASPTTTEGSAEWSHRGFPEE